MLLPWTAPALRAWLGLLRTRQNWVWPPQGSVRGRRRTQPRLSPCPGGTAVFMLRCPSNRFESALALLSSIPSRPKLSLAPWGRTTPVQSPVPHVPGYRGHARAPRVRAPSARRGCAAPWGASRARCWARKAAVGAGRRRRQEGGGQAPTQPLWISPMLYKDAQASCSSK